MEHVVELQILDNFRIAVTYDDGTFGTVDLSERFFGPVFEPLKDPHMFAQAFIDEFGVICWPNGADLAPDALYEDIRAANSAHRGKKT